MIDLNPDIVCTIIARAREFHAKEGVVIPETPNSPADDWGLQVLADHVDDPSYQELVYGINELEPDQQATLLALCWLGRGDYELEEWDSTLEDAADNVGPNFAEQLIATPLLADYLLEGLSLHGYACE